MSYLSEIMPNRLLLGTIVRPAPNAQAIIDAGASVGDGPYWIQSETGPVLTYCDMTNGGYMLAAVIESSASPFWTYNGAGWSSVTPIQENETAVYKTGTGGAAGGRTAAINSLSRLFYEYSLTTGVRCCLGNKNNALSYAYTGNNAQSLFLSTANTRFTNGVSGFGRSAWLNWFQNGTGINPNTVPGATSGQGFQPYCNQEGFNLVYGYVNGVRFGINFNEQNDCGSCDSAIGFGTNGGNYPSIQAGGYSFSPTTTYLANGYIFIK